MKLNDIQRWQIEQLARNGGYSDRAIAAYVTHSKPEKVEPDEIASVRYFRLSVRALLGDWRNMRTEASKAYADSNAKAPARKQTKVRARKRA